MEAVSYIKYIHISPKKMKALGKAIHGLSAADAMDRLVVLERKRGRILAAAIKSALSNATNNLKLDNSLMRIKTVEVLKGPSLKRWQPVSRGMAHQIRKRLSHIRIVLEESSPSQKKDETKIIKKQKKE